MNAAFKRADRGNPVSLDDVIAPAVIEALHCLRVAVTVFDADERLIFANAHFGYMFRSLPDREALVGRLYEDIIRMEVAGEIADGPVRADLDALVASRRASLFHGDYAPRDLPLADGRIVEVKTRKTPSGGWIVLWSDVTQARHNLERLNAAITLSADAFAFYDRYDKLTLCNEEYAALNGAETPDQIKGFGFNDVVDQIAAHSIAEPERAAWIEKRHELHRVPAGAMAVEMADGTAYLMRDRAASDGGRIVVFTDITEHHRVEKALDEQARALAETRAKLAASKAHAQAQANYLADLTTKLDQTTASADSTKKTLLRTMSHELKTPLNAIIGFSDLLGVLADSAGPDQIREYAGLIHSGGTNLLRMLNQIMDLTKISAGRYELNRQPIDVGQSLWGMKDRFDEAASAKSIEIAVENGDAGLVINVDEIAYGNMLSNLVENAVSFTHNGGAVRLSAQRTDNTVTITVADNGPGVAPEDLPRILEPFEQGGRSTTDHPAGAGLGLTLVRAICELHGGSLTLKSELGEGFAAIVTLPAK